MDFAKKPEVVLSVASIVISGGTLFYTNQRLNALAQTLDKVIVNVDAIGKTIGEMRPKEIVEDKLLLANLDENLKRLDKFVYMFKQEMETFKDGQLFDNETLEDTVNAVVTILNENRSDKEVLESLELTNVEPEPPVPARKRGGRVVADTKSSRTQPRQAPAPKVQFKSDEDDVESKIAMMRERRRQNK